MTGPRWTAARWAFVILVVAGAWWSWRSSGAELEQALARTSVSRVVSAYALVVVGLLLTGLVWRSALASLDDRGRARDTVPQFFLAQLGKYIPGSVWSFAAQGALGAARGVPARVPATASLLFLGVHVASGLLLVGVVGWWTPLPVWVSMGSLLLGFVGLVPLVYRWLGSRLAGRPCTWTSGRSVRAALWMVPVWCCYALALVVLAPGADLTDAVLLGSAFVLAFAVGVAVPVAPAGLGARDGVLLLLLQPELGVGAAGAVAVLARLVHTAADFSLALVAWAASRASTSPRPSGPAPADH